MGTDKDQPLEVQEEASTQEFKQIAIKIQEQNKDRRHQKSTTTFLILK
jgi:hypothetical protein